MTRFAYRRFGALVLAGLLLLCSVCLFGCESQKNPPVTAPTIRTVRPEPITATYVFMQFGTDMTNINTGNEEVLKTLTDIYLGVELKTSANLLTLNATEVIHVTFNCQDEAGVTYQVKFDLDNSGVARLNDVKYNLEDYQNVYASIKAVYDQLYQQRG